ncbi:MAG: TlpA family protein disulfide reductase [Planctomycetaceae bacterium]|nr:TlpA family protein disulfide reductase [Planctomycetaceae bacterium]
MPYQPDGRLGFTSLHQRPTFRMVAWAFGCLTLLALDQSTGQGTLNPFNGSASQAADRVKDESVLVKVGEPVPLFSVTTDDGVLLQLEELKGKVVVVTFFATWCPSCRKKLPQIDEIWSKYRQRDDFSLVAIGREETAEAVAQFKSEQGFSFPVAADPERTNYEKYAESSIPRVFVISRQGKIVYQSKGYAEKDVDTLRKVLARQLR